MFPSDQISKFTNIVSLVFNTVKNHKLFKNLHNPKSKRNAGLETTFHRKRSLTAMRCFPMVWNARIFNISFICELHCFFRVRRDVILLLFVVGQLLLNHELSHWSLLIINLSTYYLRHSNLTWWFISCISSVSFQNWWFMVNRSYFLVLLKWQWYYTLHNMCLY